jgi:hypothetical protein
MTPRRVPSCLRIACALLFGASACGRTEWEPGRTQAETLLRAAALADSGAVASISASPDVAARLAAIRRDEPAILSDARQLEVLRASSFSPDSAYVTFVFAHRGRREHLDVGFVRQLGRWRVYYLALPDRM